MFVHKVRKLDVLQCLSVRVEVVADLVHVHGDPMVDRRCAYYKREQTGRFRRFRVARLWQSRCSGTSVGRVLEFALSGPSPSVVVYYVAAFVDLEYGLEFAVDDHVHGLCKRRRKVYLDAGISLSNQVEATSVAGVGW